MKVLKLKKYLFIDETTLGIISFHSWLRKQKLQGEESRSRTKFIRFLDNYVTSFEEERKQLIEEYTEKKEIINPKTKQKEFVPILLTPDNKETTEMGINTRYKIKDMAKLSLEINKFMQDLMVIDVLPSIEKTVYAVKNIVLNSKEVFSDSMSDWYEDLCNGFENISEHQKDDIKK